MILTHSLQRKSKKLRIFAKLGDFLFENRWSSKLSLKIPPMSVFQCSYLKFLFEGMIEAAQTLKS